MTTFHGTYNFNNKLKKFYNSIMVRSDLVIAGSNFIFDHINSNYSHLINNKKLLVIFRGINTEYYSNASINDLQIKTLFSKIEISSETFKIFLPGRLTRWKGQEMFIESLNLLKKKIWKRKFSSYHIRITSG